MSPFDIWLIIVGLAIGAGLAWLVMLDLRRRDDDVAAAESQAEAGWIADTLRSRDIAADADAVEEVLRLHRAYLAGIPDDGALRPTTAPAYADAVAEAYDDEVERVVTAPPPPRPGPQPTLAPAAPPTPAAATLVPHDGAPTHGDEPEPAGEALEPAWADEDLAAAHDALETLLRKPPPEG
jgi:hypothetical protein